MQHSLGAARRIQLEHCSKVGSPAVERCAVEVAGRIPNQTRPGEFPVWMSGEVVQHALHPVLVQLEHRAKIRSTTGDCGSIEVSGPVPDQSCCGLLPVRG